MSNVGNLLSLCDALTTIASAATSLVVPADKSRFSISGSQSFSKVLGYGKANDGAFVLFQGAASAAAVFQHTATPTSEGQMWLGGGDIRLQANDVLILQVQSDGSLRLVYRQVALCEVTLASATSPAVPDYADCIILTGTVATTELVSTNIQPGRILVVKGTDVTGPALTDTAIASTANKKMHLSAALTLANGSTITFEQGANGSWWEISRAVNG